MLSDGISLVAVSLLPESVENVKSFLTQFVGVLKKLTTFSYNETIPITLKLSFSSYRSLISAFKQQRGFVLITHQKQSSDVHSSTGIIKQVHIIKTVPRLQYPNSHPPPTCNSQASVL